MARREFDCTPQLKAVMAAYFRELDEAASRKSAPVAWCTSVGPCEILRALGYKVFFPENHGAMLGASRMANRCMPGAHAIGYSQDICSYLTSDIGAYIAGRTPLQGMGMESVPRADVLVFNTNQCREVRDWLDFYGREWDVPVVGVTSVRMVDEVTDTHVDAIARQIEELVPPLEEIAGQRLDTARLEAVIALSNECSRLWGACLDEAANRPSPITFFDACVHMGPAVVMRGLQEACDYYRLLHAELAQRVAGGVGALERERFRLYWEGMPVWGKLREHAELFAELSTCVVASTYCNSWVFEPLDPADPYRALARVSLELFITRSEAPKERYIERMIERYGVDGILFHDTRTCPHNSNARYGMPSRLRQRLDIPIVVMEGDQNDLRCYSDEQSKTSIEGLIEQLAERRPVEGGAAAP